MLMNIEGFLPEPVAAAQYYKTDGTKLTVLEINSVQGQPYVLFEINGNQSSVYQDDWNEMHLTLKGGVVDPPPPPLQDTPKSSQEYDKVKRLQEFLDNGPVQDLNPDFYPTDFAERILGDEMVDKFYVKRLETTLKNIQNLRNQGEDKRCGFLNEFLWSCSGADKPLLRMCHGDWSKKAGIGGTIFGTAVLALLSGAYAAYTVSSAIWVAILVGAIWGLFIFNLDRYLVNSMYSDGTSKITPQEWRCAMPRLIIALFIGLVISAPVEMMMFDGKIQDYIQSVNQRSQSTNEILASNSSLLELKQSVDRQEFIVDSLNSQVKKYSDMFTKEVIDERRPGYGERAKQIENVLNSAREQLPAAESKLDTLHDAYNTLYSQVHCDVVKRDSLENDFSTRLESLFKVTGFYKPAESGYDRDHNPLFWVRLLVTCFFMIIEIIPVLAKMMADNGRYEKYLILEANTMDKLFSYEDEKQGALKHEDSKSETYGAEMVKEDLNKKKKSITEADNMRIYEHAVNRCTEYVISQIDEIFDIPKKNTDDYDQKRN